MPSNSGITKDALGGLGTAQTEAAGAYGPMSSIYSQMAENPMGFTQQQAANQTTAAMQAAGGSMAGAVGQGALQAARTNNAGAATAAIGDASRAASMANANAALGVQNQSALLARSQQQQGLAGLSNIYDTQSSDALGYLNTANQSSQAGADEALNWAKLGLSGAAFGTTAGAGIAGVPGFSNIYGPCWIAAELYGGWSDPRTLAIRHWLLGEFSESRIGRSIVRLYVRYGYRVAQRIKTDRPLRWAFQRIFDAALRRAGASR